MLHPVNPAAEAELLSVLSFQRKVLAFACEPTLTIPLDRGEVDAYFGEQADWFWRHTSLREQVFRLNAAVKAGPALGLAIIAAFDNDVGFDTRIDDPNYAFACCRLGGSVRDLVNTLLVMFYDFLGRDSGFPVEITGSNVLNREAVVRGFWDVNPALSVCPACDGPRPDKTNGKVHSQCDHHFPKSRHASLSIHPRNLMPTCTDCNVTFKRENDANDKAHLSEMFLPYMREAFGPLQVEVSRDVQGELSIRFIDGGGVTTPRIESLNHVLQLQERWTDRLRTRVAAPIIDNLRHQMHSAQRRGDPIDNFLDNITAQRQGARGNRGRQPDSILAEAYFSLIEADDSERHSFLDAQ